MKGLPSHIKQLNLNLLAQAHISKVPLLNMYEYYDIKTTLSKYQDNYLNNCLTIMIELPVHEKLGLTLDDLMKYDLEDLELIKKRLEEYKGTENAIINNLSQTAKPSSSRGNLAQYRHSPSGSNRRKN